MIQQLLQTWPGVIDPGLYPVVSFRKVIEPHGWLGNMSPHPLRVPRTPTGTLYPTAEHYFQCERFTDPAIRADIVSKNSPMSCKMIARRHAAAMQIMPRTPADLDLMRRTIRLKLENHPALRSQFLALPVDAVLIEDASRRGGVSARFWGMKLQDGLWTGENHLGRLWMELRLELEAGV
jgi:predicted NAD-dependent protein-ADP-ribosyltransferase YbiA (DUF1768 family)